ncbi:MAG: efflux RND transporter periplasmic adaptor subunit [Pseudomonadota bacterium]
MNKRITLTFFIGLLSCCISLPLFAKQKTHAAMPTVVTLTKAAMHEWQPTTQVVGTINAINSIKVTPLIAGQVTEIYFRSGQMVQQGQQLVQIYPNIIQAQLDKAAAQYRTSQINYERFKKLANQGYYDKADLDLKLAELESNKADVNQLQAQLSLTNITAPFAGKIGLRNISIGDYLSPGDSITTLEATDPLRVDFTLSEHYISQVKLGNTVKIISRAFPNKAFEGPIYAFNSIVDPNTRTLDMRAKISNPKNELIPGTFVEVTVSLGKKERVIFLPQNAIVYASDGTFVYLMKDHKAIRTKIKLGPLIQNNQAVVFDGVKAGDEVITGGQLKLSDGSAVMTQEEAQAYFKNMQKKK